MPGASANDPMAHRTRAAAPINKAKKKSPAGPPQPARAPVTHEEGRRMRVKLPDSQAVSTQLRIASVVFRVVFIVSLLVVTVRVSLPQNETIWTGMTAPAPRPPFSGVYSLCMARGSGLDHAQGCAGASDVDLHWTSGDPLCADLHRRHMVSR
jgi:hypothetical protein